MKAVPNASESLADVTLHLCAVGNTISYSQGP